MKQKNRIPSSKTYDGMGIWLYGKKLCWTSRGFGHKYIPQFILKRIVHIWNKISCLIFGHFYFSLKKDKYDTCCDCMKRKRKND